MNKITQKLHKGSIKLAGLYLAIIFAISLFFSATIYQLSVQELDRGLRGPRGGIERAVGQNFSKEMRNDLLAEREQLYNEAKDRVLERLLLTNLVILVAGGFLSYYLAVRTLKPIEEAHEAQSRFTADASHELRTPITAMMTETEVTLMDSNLSLDDAKKQLASNVEELQKLTALSDGLMRLAGLENTSLHQESVALNDVLQKAIEKQSISAHEKTITISFTANKLPNVLGDAQSLQELFAILIDNAIKYSPKKSKISITAKHNQHVVVVSVADNGIGIKASEIPYIFDRFYRADASRTKQHITGYGLGLAIAKNIVDMHKGSIQVSSTPNKGTTFIVSLPIAK